MTQKSKTRIYVTVIVVGLAAMFVDRFLLGGSTLPASVSATEPVTGPVRAKSDETLAGLSIPELPFPRNLPDAGDRPSTRDLFAFSDASGQSLDTPGRDGRGAASPGKGLSDSASFSSRNRLDAVLLDSGFQIAVVNGVWITTKQELDGCILNRIEKTRAYFTCGQDQAVLDLAK